MWIIYTKIVKIITSKLIKNRHNNSCYGIIIN